jgi:hypothetical protein
MNACKIGRDEWIAYVGHELDAGREDALRRHLGSCRPCRDEVESLRALFDETGAVGDEIRAAMASVDWKTLPARIAARLPERAPATPGLGARLRELAWSPRLRPALAGLAAGIILGGAAAFIALRGPFGRGDGADFHASGEFLERVELELARRQTLDYLDKSQYLILDVLETPAGSGLSRPDAAASLEARDLIARKKYLNPRLDDLRMAKAKDICDQIELLVFELSQLSPEVGAAEVERIRGMVRDRQLLMKIRLVKKELEQSEV